MFPGAPWKTFRYYREPRLEVKLLSPKLLGVGQWDAIKGDVIPGTNALVEMTVRMVPRKIEGLYQRESDGKFGRMVEGMPLTFFCNHARELHVMCETSTIFNEKQSIFHWPSPLVKADAVHASGPLKYLSDESLQTRAVENDDARITHIWVPISYLIIKNRRFMRRKSNFGRMRGVSLRGIELLMVKWKLLVSHLTMENLSTNFGRAIQGTNHFRFWSLLACY